MRAKSFSGVLTLVGILVFAELACIVGLFETRFFPRPSIALGRLVELLLSSEETSSGRFHDHLKASAIRLTSGIALASFFCLTFTIAAGFSTFTKRVASVIVGFLYPLPKSAVFPLFLMIFGIGNHAHIALILIGSLAIMLATTLAGLQRIEASGYLEVARVLRLPPVVRIRRVLVPGLMPEFMNGLKLGSSYGIVLLIVAEMIVTRHGLGVYLWASWDQFKIVDLYATFYLISLTGLAVFGIFDFLAERSMNSQRAV